MPKGDYFFPLYYQKLLASTQGWKDDEFGAYIRLLIYQYDKGFVPNDIKQINRIAPTAKKNWDLLKLKFQDDGNGNLINLIMKGIRDKRIKKAEVNLKNGMKGGRPPNNQNETENNPNGFQNGSNNSMDNGLVYTDSSFEEDGPEGGTFESEIDIDLLLQKVILDAEYRKSCEGAGFPPSKLERWMEAFNRFLKFKGQHRCREDMWRLGFPGWMAYHNYQNGENPDEYNPVIWARKKKEDYDKIFKNGTHQQNNSRSAEAKPGVSKARTKGLNEW